MIEDIHRWLAIPADSQQAEGSELVDIGLDMFFRPQRLAREAAASWGEPSAADESCGVELLVVSAFRSVKYQAHLFEVKLRRGHDCIALAERKYCLFSDYDALRPTQ